ncbi:MAG: GntR family transcriptional regulator [Actinomycetota bacterium]
MSLNLPQIEPQETITGRLYTELEEAIIDGRLAPGQRVHADEIAEHFRVSRIPVREALRALQANGWLEIRPRRETIVPAQTPEDLEDLFEVRVLLDARAASLAAERRSEQDLEALHALVQESRSASGDMAALARLNEQFHVAVARASRNALLETLVQTLAKRVRWYFAQVAPVRAAHSVREHGDLLQAIRQGTGPRAAEIASAHIERTRSAASTAIRARGD